MRLFFSLVFFFCFVQVYSDITIRAAGDTMFGTEFPERIMPRGDGTLLFSGVSNYLEQNKVDLFFVNYEGTFTIETNTPKKISKGRSFAFKTPPDFISLLTRYHFDAVTLANNHSYDFGKKGLLETRSNLLLQNIIPIGNKNEIHYFTKNGVKIGLTSFSWIPLHNNINDMAKSMNWINEISKECDILILSIHSGCEGKMALHLTHTNEIFYEVDRGNIVDFSRKAIDNGADLIIGHGPHVVRAMEIYKNRLIAYSLGNFITFGSFSTHGYNKYTLILDVVMDATGHFQYGQIYPLLQSEKPSLRGIPYYDSTKKVITLIKDLSQKDIVDNPIEINDDGKIIIKQ